MSFDSIKQFFMRLTLWEKVVGGLIVAFILGAIQFAWLLIRKHWCSGDTRPISPRSSGDTKPTSPRLEEESCKVSPEPSYLNYTSDNILGIDWHWRYLAGALHGNFLTARCPKCKTIMNKAGLFENGTLYCGACGYRKTFNTGLRTVMNKVLLEIERKIHTNEYKSAQPPS